MKARICDICGKPIGCHHYPWKLRIKRHLVDGWDRMDICDDCQYKIIGICNRKNFKGDADVDG